MNIDWDKWQAIEAEHNRLESAEKFARQRLDEATLNARNVEAALLRAATGFGVFRRFAAGDWLMGIKANPDAALAHHAEHSLNSIMSQFVDTLRQLDRATTAHGRAESALAKHSQSFFRIRNWIYEQQSRGLI